MVRATVVALNDIGVILITLYTAKQLYKDCRYLPTSFQETTFEVFETFVLTIHSNDCMPILSNNFFQVVPVATSPACIYDVCDLGP